MAARLLRNGVFLTIKRISFIPIFAKSVRFVRNMMWLYL
ncbi:Uncharacterised protein [Vibrio cholerae]|nr:Uncharacterised protein [Vibrio cholerae]